MSRKDYEAIAGAIRKVADLPLDVVASAAVELTARNVADELEQENPRFDRARFLEAALGEQ